MKEKLIANSTHRTRLAQVTREQLLGIVVEEVLQWLLIFPGLSVAVAYRVQRGD